jgi:hypothetical protein
MTNQSKIAVILIALGVAGLAMVGWLMLSSSRLAFLVETAAPGFVPASHWASFLESGDRDTVLSGFYHLSKRRDAIAVERAIPMLQSTDDYIWLNAAQYLGACEREEAVPYLIKSLRHTAWRSLNERVTWLESITGQTFGRDFAAWKTWWIESHPKTPIAWDTGLGFNPNWEVTTKQ